MDTAWLERVTWRMDTRQRMVGEGDMDTAWLERSTLADGQHMVGEDNMDTAWLERALWRQSLAI